ncbi:MAG: GNAT family N-acetyltransferase [Clostridiales bacterium]|nr:GNAT family N-acetyltransferase [Clostridiales bacterium]
MVHGKWFPMGSDISLPISIRESVFSRGRDQLDDMAWQVAVFKDDAAVASARLWWADGSFFVGDIGVLEAERGNGFGDLLIRLLLFKALSHSANVISLDAPSDAVPFFQKYGFGASEPASARMTILADDIMLSHCGGNCEGCKHQTDDCIPKALR